MHSLRFLTVAAAAACLFLAVRSAAADRLAVEKVEPPHWWRGLKLSTIEVLSTGEGLSGARVTADDPGLTPGPVTASANGHYAFFDLAISPEARAGPHVLTVASGAGRSRRFHFELKEAPRRAGRFQGIGTKDVLYQLMPDRFARHRGAPEPGRRGEPAVDRGDPRAWHGGTFRGVEEHLPYLEELGVTAVLLTPVYRGGEWQHPRWNAGYHGYWIEDFYDAEPRLGGLAAYERLVRAAHARGLKVIQDQIHNHTSPGHRWAKDPPTATWFHEPPTKDSPTSYDIGALVDPHASELAKKRVLDGWFGGDLPDLNQDDPRVAKYLIQNAVWWVAETGVDAIRLDAYPHVPQSYWTRFHRALAAEFGDVNTVGEVASDAPDVCSAFQAGRDGRPGADGGPRCLFDFPLARAVRSALGEKNDLRLIPAVLRQDRLYPDPDGGLVTFVGNHDDFPRLATALNERLDRVKLAYAILLAGRGIPQFYMGDETGGMLGDRDPWNRRDFPGGFPGDAHSAFDRKRRTAREKELIDFVAEWAKARRGSEALSSGALTTLAIDRDLWVFLRHTRGERVLVALSLSGESRKVSLPFSSELAGTRALTPLVSGTPDAGVSKSVVEFTLPAYGIAAWRAGGASAR